MMKFIFLNKFYLFFYNRKFRSELLKMIKKASTFLLNSDEDLTSNFLENIKKLVQLSESHTSFIDLDNWLYILNKLHDHFRSVKTKTNVINVSSILKIKAFTNKYLIINCFVR